MIEDFLKYNCQNKGLSANTEKAYGEALRQFARWLQTSAAVYRWRDVTKRDIDQYVQYMASSEKKPATIRQHISAIRQLFAWMKKLELIKHSPARWVETPKLRKQLPSTIEITAIENYIADVKQPLQTRAMVALIYEAGLRISEVMNLDTRLISWRNHSMKVEGKGMKERIVYYGYWTDKLLNMLANGKRGKIFEGTEREARREIWHALKGHEIGQRQASPHIIRHTFATRMLNQGMPITSLQMLLGHESVKTTEIYAHAAGTTVKNDYQRATANG